jgi:hypothetical protein
MYSHDRMCCVCEVFGLGVQIHHIDEDPTNHNPDNLAVLCLQHHEETQVRGGFGRKLVADDVRHARDELVLKVSVRRQRAEEARLRAMVGGPRESPSLSSLDPELAAYVERLPAILRAARDLADDQWGGSTYDQLEAAAAVFQVVREAWLKLAGFFPAGHFGDDADAYFQQALDARRAWHQRFTGSSGTIWPLILSRQVLNEAQRMVGDTVLGLAGLGASARELDGWSAAWKEAGRIRR